MSPRNSSDLEQEETFLNSGDEKGRYSSLNTRHQSGRKLNTLLPWMISASFFLISLLLSLHIILKPACLPSPHGSFDAGYDTDLEPAKVAIEAHKVRFTGELKWHENGTMYRDYPANQPSYVGPPSPEIDAAWDDLMYSAGLDLGDKEAESIKDTTFEEPQGGLWRTGLEVFHVLHCVNMIRQELDPEYYPPKDPHRLQRMHRDHCIDYIRQSVMCAADATPVRLEWRKESRFLIPKFDNYHTCRNFELLHDWSRKRALEIHVDEDIQAIKEKVAEGVL